MQLPTGDLLVALQPGAVSHASRAVLSATLTSDTIGIGRLVHALGARSVCRATAGSN